MATHAPRLKLIMNQPVSLILGAPVQFRHLWSGRRVPGCEHFVSYVSGPCPVCKAPAKIDPGPVATFDPTTMTLGAMKLPVLSYTQGNRSYLVGRKVFGPVRPLDQSAPFRLTSATTLGILTEVKHQLSLIGAWNEADFGIWIYHG